MMNNSNLRRTYARRRPAMAALSLMVAAALFLGNLLPVTAETKTAGKKLTEGQKIIHLLNRIGYGPRPGDVERVRALGVDKFIDQQLHPERIADAATEARLSGFESLRMEIAALYDKYPQPNMIARQLGLRPGKQNQQRKPGENAAGQPDAEEAKQDQREMRQQIFAYYREKGLKPPNMLLQELQAQKLIRAVYSERQLQEVMTDFWFNHFNIFWAKGADRWMTTDFEMNAIRPHTLGKFQDLLLATAKSPAMLFYLDNFQSSSPDTQMPGRRGQFQRRRGQAGKGFGLFGGKDERRQRQVEQGQMTPEEQQRRQQALEQFRRRKPGINENYAREIMELHTLGVDGGYTQKDVQEVARCFTGWTIQQPRQNGTFVFREFMHDKGEKVVLGYKIPAGGGMKDGEKVIEILARHPNTAKFISTKLVRRFVSDNPPQSLVDRVAGVYMKTGGDIREMMKTILTAQEFYAPEAYRAKIKSPFELAVSAIRALNGNTSGMPQLAQFISKMGQPLYLYQAPTGYPDRAEQWVNTGALLERLNFGLALSSNRVRGTAVDPKGLTASVKTSDPARLMDHAIKVLLHNDVSAATRSVLEKQLKEGVPVKGQLGEVPQIATNREDRPASDDAMMAGGTPEGSPLRGKGNNGIRRAERMGWGIQGNVPSPSIDPEIAKVFGLVLGSPEFQRR